MSDINLFNPNLSKSDNKNIILSDINDKDKENKKSNKVLFDFFNTNVKTDNTLDDKELNSIIKFAKSADKNNNGKLEDDEQTDLYNQFTSTKNNKTISKQNFISFIKNIMDMLNQNNNKLNTSLDNLKDNKAFKLNKISINGFNNEILNAYIEDNNIDESSKKNMNELFNYFDNDKNGNISKFGLTDLAVLLKRFGLDYDKSIDDIDTASMLNEMKASNPQLNQCSEKDLKTFIKIIYSYTNQQSKNNKTTAYIETETSASDLEKYDSNGDKILTLEEYAHKNGIAANKAKL